MDSNTIMEHTSLELSKRLHEKGFRGEHKQVWFEGKTQWHMGIKSAWRDPRYKSIPAYTFTELWGVLPKWVKLHKFRHSSVARFLYGGVGHNFEHESPAEAIGLLLEWLIGEGHYQCDTREGDKTPNVLKGRPFNIRRVKG
jgi:hypothetical protein